MAAESGRLAGKVALITGAARGQGAAEARLFVAQGAKVVLGDVLEEGQAVAESLGDAARFVRMDIRREQDWLAAVAAAQAFGPLNVLLNNAAVVHFSSIVDTTLEDYKRVIDINQLGTFLGIRSVVEPMKAAGGGSIINISSTAGLVGSRTSAAYSASKGAVRIFSKSTAIQYAAEGIRANSIHPGPIDTDMGDQVWPDAESKERTMNRVALSRIGTAEDVAYGALYLASDESSFVTGSELVIDGGVTAQ